jgi:hypothetical protein
MLVADLSTQHQLENIELPGFPTHDLHSIKTRSSKFLCTYIYSNMATIRVLSSISLDDIYALVRPVMLQPSSPRSIFTNWGQTFTCKPLAVFEPETEYQCEVILELVRREKKTIRAAGVGHSPSDLACTSEYMLRTSKLNQLVEASDLFCNVLPMPFASLDISLRYKMLKFFSLEG